MAEFVSVEVGAQVAIQASKHVQVEGGGGSGSIIVGGEQGGFRLVFARYEVRAQQKRIAGEQLC